MRRRLLAALAGDVLPATVLLALGLCALGTLASLAQAVTRSGLAPSPAGVAALAAGALPAVAGVALPAALLFGATAAARVWSESGELLALQVAGHGLRRLVGPAVVIGLAVGVVEAGLTHLAEPAGRSLAHQALVAAARDVRLLPGQPVQVGDVLLHAESVTAQGMGDVFLATADFAATAPSGRIEDGQLVLEHGRALQLGSRSEQLGDVEPGWTLRFERATFPLSPSIPRVDPPELSTGALLGLIGRMEASGRAPLLERTTLYKRTLLPLSVPVLALLGLALGARGVRPAVAATVTVLSWWVLMRLCDQAVASLGPALSASIPPLALAAAAASSWAGWRDR